MSIIFNGVKYKNKMGHLIFVDSDKKNVFIEIPMEDIVIQRITSYLGKMTVPILSPQYGDVIDENE